jgi:hypothetical protein
LSSRAKQAIVAKVMKKIPIILFILIAIIILSFAIFSHIHPDTDNNIAGAKTIVPFSPGEEPEKKQEENIDAEAVNMTSLITLNRDETLINVYTVDFDKDGYDDQIISVKRASSPYIFVIIGLYNSVYATYDRTVTLETKIDQIQTFSYYVRDITGTHTNTLVLTGFDDKNNSVMKAYMPSRSSSKLQLKNVLDLSVDGTIFVQQISQIATYDLGQTDGASYPIWVYMSDPEAQEGSLDQLQIEYLWDKNDYIYKKGQIKQITGKSITAQELRKIQDGTVDTFAEFLNGLWIKSTSSEDELRYISFDYDNKEIDFAEKDAQEIFDWKQSTLRRNGILLMLNNTSITSLTRRFDIALVSTDEINIKISDDVGMPIGADPLWDGNYKKVNSVEKTEQNKTTEKTSSKENTIINTLLAENSSWTTDTDYTIEFTTESFKAIPQNTNDSHSKISIPEEKGIISKFTIRGEEFLELRSSLPESNFTGTYRMSSTKEEGESATTIQVTLIPVTIQVDLTEEKNRKPLHLSRTIKTDNTTK